MIHRQRRHAQAVLLVFWCSLSPCRLSPSAGAQPQPDTSSRAMQRRIELAAAVYMRGQLLEDAARRGGSADGLALDQRATDPRHDLDDSVPRPKRDARQAAALARVLYARLVDGRNAITCDSADSGPCRFTISRGMLRISTPDVDRDTADVSVHLLERGWGRMPIHRMSWGLTLVRRSGAWTVVPQLSTRGQT